MDKNSKIKWIVTTLIVLIGVFVLIRLGFWQLNRLESRREFNAHYLEQISASQINLNDDSNYQDLLSMEYRHVEVSGNYDFSNEIYLQNQAWNNLPGYKVVTPLIMDGDNDVVFIDRGWISLDDLEEIQLINSQYKKHQILKGIIRLPQSKSDFGGKNSPQNESDSKFFLYVDLGLFQEEVDYPLLPIYIQIYDEKNNEKPYSSLPEIEISEGPHLGYAIQWFFFASLLGFGYPFYLKKQLRNDLPRSRE